MNMGGKTGGRGRERIKEKGMGMDLTKALYLCCNHKTVKKNTCKLKNSFLFKISNQTLPQSFPSFTHSVLQSSFSLIPQPQIYSLKNL